MIEVKTIRGKITGSAKEMFGVCAFLDGKFAGTCTLNYFNTNIPSIFSLIVIEECRGMGIGTAILQKCLELCKDKVAVNLWVDKKNPDAMRLYKRLGFKVCGDDEDVMMTHSVNN